MQYKDNNSALTWHKIRYTYSARIGENAWETLAFSPILSLIRISILCQVNALLLSIYTYSNPNLYILSAWNSTHKHTPAIDLLKWHLMFCMLSDQLYVDVKYTEKYLRQPIGAKYSESEITNDNFKVICFNLTWTIL